MQLTERHMELMREARGLVHILNSQLGAALPTPNMQGLAIRSDVATMLTTAARLSTALTRMLFGAEWLESGVSVSETEPDTADLFEVSGMDLYHASKYLNALGAGRYHQASEELPDYWSKKILAIADRFDRALLTRAVSNPAGRLDIVRSDDLKRAIADLTELDNAKAGALMDSAEVIPMPKLSPPPTTVEVGVGRLGVSPPANEAEAIYDEGFFSMDSDAVCPYPLTDLPDVRNWQQGLVDRILRHSKGLEVYPDDDAKRAFPKVGGNYLRHAWFDGFNAGEL